MQTHWIVNYCGSEEKHALQQYLKHKGFACIDLGWSGTNNDHYGFLVKLEERKYWSMRPAFMAAACSHLGQPLTLQTFLRLYEAFEKPDRRTVAVHIPHAGERFPPETGLLVDDAERQRQHDTLRDAYVTKMIPRLCDQVIAFDYSRLICDVERFEENEPMAQYGMGICYTHGFDGRVLRREDDTASRGRAKALYRAHHRKWSALCETTKKLFILDLHSYQRKIIPDEMIRKDRNLPDVCLGFDERFLRPEIADFAAKKFLEAGYSVAFNFPYAGSFVPQEILKEPDAFDCLSLMVEVNRIVFEHGQDAPRRRVRERLDNILLYVMQHDE